MNLLLALFNMIPGFPLDGGRVLRALLWQRTGRFQRATEIAAFAGQLVAVGFIGWGAYSVFRGSFFNGLWLIFVGWFLQNAAAGALAHANLQLALRGVTVRQVMARQSPYVSSRYTLRQLVEQHVVRGGRRYFFVAENGAPSGMLTLADVTGVPEATWNEITVEQVMVPWEELVSVHPDAELRSALQRMDDAGVAQLPVVARGELVGVLSRDQILHYIQTCAELGV